MNTGTQSTRRLWVALVAVIGIGVGSYIWMTAPKDEDRGLMRVVRQVTNSVNPDELQRWAGGILRTNDWSVTNTVWRPDLASNSLVSKIPPLGHFPAQVCLNGPTEENGHRTSMVLLYLGGFGSWAIYVGDETFYLRDDRHCYQWISGVYIETYP